MDVLEREALAELQRELLCHRGIDREREYDKVIGEFYELTTARGFEPVGCGSTRIGVAVDGGVAKVAHNWMGLLFNLQEAASWLLLPGSVRQVVVPIKLLTPELVLIGRWVEVLGPPLPDLIMLDDGSAEEGDLWQELFAAIEDYWEEIAEVRETLGLAPLDSDTPPRVDNHGLLDGRVVKIDYAEVWKPVPLMLRWLLDQLDEGSMSTDMAARANYFAYLDDRLGNDERLPDRGPDATELTDRAGLDPVCECEPDSTPDPEDCVYHVNLVGYLAGTCMVSKAPARGFEQMVNRLGAQFVQRTRRQALEFAMKRAMGLA